MFFRLEKPWRTLTLGYILALLVLHRHQAVARILFRGAGGKEPIFLIIWQKSELKKRFPLPPPPPPPWWCRRRDSIHVSILLHYHVLGRRDSRTYLYSWVFAGSRRAVALILINPRLHWVKSGTIIHWNIYSHGICNNKNWRLEIPFINDIKRSIFLRRVHA
jgi:hypothetical protein